MKNHTKEITVISIGAIACISFFLKAALVCISLLTILLMLFFLLNPFNIFSKRFAPLTRRCIGAGIGAAFCGVLFGVTWNAVSLIFGGVIVFFALLFVSWKMNPWLMNGDEQRTKRIVSVLTAENGDQQGNPGRIMQVWHKNGYEEMRKILIHYDMDMGEEFLRLCRLAYVLGWSTAAKTDDDIDKLKVERDSAKKELFNVKKELAEYSDCLDEANEEIEGLESKCKELEYSLKETENQVKYFEGMARTYALELGIGNENEDGEKTKRNWSEVTPEEAYYMHLHKTLREMAEEYNVGSPATIKRKVDKYLSTEHWH